VTHPLSFLSHREAEFIESIRESRAPFQNIDASTLAQRDVRRETRKRHRR
jgi:hypothetical protein